MRHSASIGYIMIYGELAEGHWLDCSIVLTCAALGPVKRGPLKQSSHYWGHYPGDSHIHVKSLPHIWRSGTRRFHLELADLQMSRNDLGKVKTYRETHE